MFELIFYTLLLLSVVMIFLGTYWIFSSDGDNDCSGYVYVCSAFFNIVQYVLYALSAIYVLVTVVCVRGIHKVMNQ